MIFFDIVNPVHKYDAVFGILAPDTKEKMQNISNYAQIRAVNFM